MAVRPSAQIRKLRSYTDFTVTNEFSVVSSKSHDAEDGAYVSK